MDINKFLPLMLALLLLALPAAAHVTLNPREAVAGYQVFEVRVPTEREVATTSVQLIVPEGVHIGGILPLPGWAYETIKEHMSETEDDAAATKTSEHEEDAHEEEAEITSITWSGGAIKPGEYQSFYISTRYQGDPSQLIWKAYQTYADGDVVAWDDATDGHPAPRVTILKETKLDALTAAVNELQAAKPLDNKVILLTWLVVGSALLSVASFALSLRKR